MATTKKAKRVITVRGSQWVKILKNPNIKRVSNRGGKDGVDYGIIYKNNTEKLYKFA